MGYTFLIISALVGCTFGLIIHENVVFHKTNEISSNHARWLVTFIHDLRPYEVFIDKINKDLQVTHDVMTAMTDWYRQFNYTGYVFTYESLHEEIGMLNDTYQSVKDNFIDYKSLKSGHERHKRSLLPIIGQAMSFLFGTVSDLDLENIQRSIGNLARNQENIIHNLEESMTILNLSRIQIAENRRAIMDLVECVLRLDDKVKELETLVQSRFARLEQFISTYFQFKLILDEIRQSSQNAILYLENLRVELNMLSLNHLSPSTISPRSLRKLLLEIRNKLPSSMKLPADPVTDIWYFYNTLSCTAYLDGHKILIVLSIPLLDRKETYEVYKIHNLPLPMHNMTATDGKDISMIAKYDLQFDSFMINADRTKYALLSSTEYRACNNRYIHFCNPKSAIYPVNLSKSCVIALFLRHTENIKQNCKSIVYFDSRLPTAQYIHSGIWVVATYKMLKFTIVCEDQSTAQGDVIVHPPLGIVKLSTTCWASNDYLTLPPFYEIKAESQVTDTWGSLLQLKNITRFSLWQNFSSTFPKLPSLEIPDKLKNLREIPMPSFIDYVHNYRKVDIKGKSLSLWAWIIIIFSTFIAFLVIYIVYKKYFRKRVQLDCRKRLANCCNDENVVMGTSTVEEKRLASSRVDEVVSHKPGRRLSSTPSPKEAKITMASLMRDAKV